MANENIGLTPHQMSGNIPDVCSKCLERYIISLPLGMSKNTKLIEGG